MPSLQQSSLYRSKGELCIGVPHEVLSRIFEFGTPMINSSRDFACYWRGFEHFGGLDSLDDGGGILAEESGQANSTDTRPLPPFQIIVCRVCRYWREVAIATPSLWTLIAVSPDARPPYEHVSTLLQRSKTLPIDIHIEDSRIEQREGTLQWAETVDRLYRYRSPAEPLTLIPATSSSGVSLSGPPESNLSATTVHLEDDDTLPLVDDKRLYSLLVPHLHRWRSIHLRFSPYQNVREFFDAVSNASGSAAPHLKVLVLVKPDSTVDSSWNASSFTLFQGSCLEYVQLVGGHFNWDQPWLTTSSTLTTLKLENHNDPVRPSWTQFATMLRGLPQLQTLELMASGPRMPEHNLVPTHLPNLTHLVIGDQSLPRALGLFRRLSMPALKRLTLKFLKFSPTDSSNLVKRLAGPATATGTEARPRSLLSDLERLDILGLPCHHDDIVMLYDKLLNLRVLHVMANEYRHRRFLNILCSPCSSSGQDTWLPRLETLSVSIGMVNYRLIRDVVQKRKEAGFPIKSLRLEAPDVDNEMLMWFKINVESFVHLEEAKQMSDLYCMPPQLFLVWS